LGSCAILPQLLGVGLVSSYLKAMQLTKQLEEKAKEEKKNRQLAETEMQKMQDSIKAAKSSDIETNKAESFLAKAISTLEEKNYRESLTFLAQANDQLKKDYTAGVEVILNAVSNLMDLVKSIGADCTAGQTIYNDSKSTIEKGDLEKALRLAKQSWESLEKVAQEQLSMSFSNTQSMVVLARNSGEDVAGCETLLEQARKAIDSQDYSSAFSRLKECMDSVGSGLSSQVEALLDEAKGYQITAKELGAEVTRIEELIKRADEDIQKNKLESALSSARLSKSEAEKTLNRAVGDYIQKQELTIQEAEKIQANTDRAVEILNISRLALKNGNYGDAISSVKECETELYNSQFQIVLTTISQSKSKFMVANKVGADLTEAMGFLNRGREALKNGNFSEALVMARQGDEAVEHIVKEYQEIENTIAGLEEQVKVGVNNGVTMTASESTLASARDALASRDYDSALSYVKQAREEINTAMYSFATDCIETAELVISAGDKLGTNLEEPENLMKSAISAAKEKNFYKAAELAKESTTRAEDIIKIHVSNTIASAELAIYDAENVDVEVVKGLIDSAKTEFQNYAFDKAFEYADKALNMLETGQSAKAREQVKKMTDAIQTAKKMECDVSSLEEISRKCSEHLNNRDFLNALSEAEKAYKDLMNLQYVAAERMFGEAKLAAIEAKKLGIDITDMREALKRAKVSFSEEDFFKTFKESQIAKQAADRQIKLHQNAYDAITQAAAMIAEAKKNKADVKNVMAILTSAKSMFEHFDYENALKEAEKAKVETEMVVKQYTAASKLSTVNEHISLLASLEQTLADIGQTNEYNAVRVMAEEVNRTLQSRNFEAANAQAEKAQTKARQLVELAISNLISSTELKILDATDHKIDVSAQVDKLEHARKFLRETQYKDAMAYAKSAMQEIETIKELSQRAAVEIKVAQDKLNEGETLHADMDRSKQLLGDALTELKSSRYERAIELAMESAGEARKSIENFVSETIKAVKVSIEKAKMDGTTVAAAERLMSQAMGAFSSKDYKMALSFAMKSEGELEKVGLQQEMAEKAIMTAEMKLKEAKGLGVHSAKAISLLEEARTSIKKGEYVKALEFAIQSGDELHNVGEEFREANDALHLLQSQIEIATKVSAEVSIAKKMLADSKSAVKDHDYKTAIEIAKEGINETRRLSHSRLSSILSEVYKLSDLASDHDLDTSGVSSLLAEAKTFIDSGKYEISFEKIKYCSDELASRLNTHIKDIFAQSERSMQHAKELGADITESSKMLAEAKKAFDIGKFRDALVLAEKSKSAVDLKKGFEREFIELTYEAEKIVSNAKKFGINVKEPEALFKQARELKVNNYQAALETLKKSVSLANEAMNNFKPRIKALLSVNKVENNTWTEAKVMLVNEGKSLGSNVTVSLLGDVTTEGKTVVENLRGLGGQAEIPIKMKFENPGEMPVIIKIKSTRMMDGQTFEDESLTSVFVIETQITPLPVMKAEMSLAFEKLKAVADTKCNICMGKVKVGLDIIKCSCGKEYHAMCGTRFGKCPTCNTSFTEKLDRDAEKALGDLEINGKYAQKPSAPAPMPEQKAPEPEPKPVEKKPEEPKPPVQPPQTPPVEPEQKPEEEKKVAKKRLALKF
jgi:hypothetical protein